MHVHCNELENIDAYKDEYVLVCVAEDIESTVKIIELVDKYTNIEPCIGIHPWNIEKYDINSVKNMLENYLKIHDIECLGEIGLDKRFKPVTYSRQLELFKLFIDYAKEYDLVLNLHAADAWREVFELLYKRDIDKAYFHWYTGPLDLLHEIENMNYYIGANPAWKIQQKHRSILEIARLEHIITESDAPYNYKGLVMMPELIVETIKHLSDVKKLNYDLVVEKIYSNYKVLFRR